MGKDMTYYRIMDFTKNECCPICSLVNYQTKQAMDGFLYESVNDPAIRKELSKSGGLCNYHSDMLCRMGDPLAHAIIYSDLICDVIQQLSKPFGHTYNKGDCYFCKEAIKGEEIYENAFLTYFEEAEFSEHYRQNGVLCARHLFAILSLGTKNGGYSERVANEIKDATVEKYKKLIGQLEEIRRKNDYRFSEEPWSEGAKDSWQRAVNIINDRAGTRK